MEQISHLERMERAYLSEGLPMTTQRRALIEVLASRKDHPTVDEIFSKLSRRIPEVSRTTVYRSLEMFTELGLIKRVEHPDAAARFDPNVSEHHHFLCTNCGGLSDLPAGALRGVRRLAYVGKGKHTAEEISVLVRGSCDDCSA